MEACMHEIVCGPPTNTTACWKNQAHRKIRLTVRKIKWRCPALMRKNICLIFNLHALPPLVPLFLLTHLFFLAHTAEHQKWVCENENKFIKRKVTR